MFALNNLEVLKKLIRIIEYCQGNIYYRGTWRCLVIDDFTKCLNNLFGTLGNDLNIRTAIGNTALDVETFSKAINEWTKANTLHYPKDFDIV